MPKVEKVDDLPLVNAPVPTPIISNSDEVIGEPIDPDIIEGKRVRMPSAKVRDIMEGRATGNEYNLIAFDVTATDPLTLAEAMRRPDAESWKEAIDDEIHRLESRKSWEYVNPPDNANIIDSKLVFRIKRNERGEITGYRARLVARGFTQIPGVDYNTDDTFAPVVKLASARTILAIAAQHNYEIHQMDVKSAYLYGKLGPDEIVFMQPPNGIKLKGLKPGQALKLSVSLYGLKQAGRRWALKF